MVDVYSHPTCLGRMAVSKKISVLLKHWIQLSVVSLGPAGTDNAAFDITFSPERSETAQPPFKPGKPPGLE